jgi:hypothetical protein
MVAVVIKLRKYCKCLGMEHHINCCKLIVRWCIYSEFSLPLFLRHSYAAVPNGSCWWKLLEEVVLWCESNILCSFRRIYSKESRKIWKVSSLRIIFVFICAQTYACYLTNYYFIHSVITVSYRLLSCR